MPKKVLPSERRKQREKQKLDKQQVASEVLQKRISADDFSKPRPMPSHRKSAVRGAPNFHLIVCEDLKSGRFYLEDLVDSMQLSSVKVEVMSSARVAGTDPQTVVTFAQNKLSENRKIQEVFVVFDGDSALLGGIDKQRFDAAIAKSASLPKMEAFVSTPCLEFWFVLHYEFRDTAYERRNVDGRWTFCGHVCEGLGKKISDGKGYKKSAEDIFSRLKEKFPQGRVQAMKNAQRLRDEAGSSYSNPSTDMDLLLHRLEALRL